MVNSSHHCLIHILRIIRITIIIITFYHVKKNLKLKKKSKLKYLWIHFLRLYIFYIFSSEIIIIHIISHSNFLQHKFFHRHESPNELSTRTMPSTAVEKMDSFLSSIKSRCCCCCRCYRCYYYHRVFMDAWKKYVSFVLWRVTRTRSRSSGNWHWITLVHRVYRIIPPPLLPLCHFSLPLPLMPRIFLRKRGFFCAFCFSG